MMKHGKIMKFCYEMPVWMSFPGSLDKLSSVFQKGMQTYLSSSENNVLGSKLLLQYNYLLLPFKNCYMTKKINKQKN